MCFIEGFIDNRSICWHFCLLNWEQGNIDGCYIASVSENNLFGMIWLSPSNKMEDLLLLWSFYFKYMHDIVILFVNFVMWCCSGSIDGNNQLIIKGRFQQKQIESVLRRYISEFCITPLFVYHKTFSLCILHLVSLCIFRINGKMIDCVSFLLIGYVGLLCEWNNRNKWLFYILFYVVINQLSKISDPTDHRVAAKKYMLFKQVRYFMST